MSLGFPIHFPLGDFGVEVASLAPLVDVTTRSLFTFAIENYHNQRLGKTVNSVLVPGTTFADFFRESLLIKHVEMTMKG